MGGSHLVNRMSDLVNRRFPFSNRMSDLVNRTSDLVNRKRGTLYIEGERGIFEKVVTASKMYFWHIWRPIAKWFVA